MHQASRFGRKLALPSTAQIKNELRLLMASDSLIEAAREQHLSDDEVKEAIRDFLEKDGSSSKRGGDLFARAKEGGVPAV